MFTKNDLLTQLAALGIDKKGTLMVHLSCRAIGDVDGRGQAVLDALAEYMEEGLLVLPTHTWAFVSDNNPVMDMLHTKSSVGAVTELFRKRPDVHRSKHPTHSVAALGRDAEDFVSGEEAMRSPCGKDGVYYKLWQRNAQILLIGVNFMRNTIIHGFEEWDGATGSISAELVDRYIIDKEGTRLHTPQHSHCSRLSSETFTKLEPQALQEGILKIGSFGDAAARVMHAGPLRTMVAALLKEDSTYLLRY